MSERVRVFEVEMILEDELGAAAVPTASDLRALLTPYAAMVWAEKSIDLRDVLVNMVYDSADDPDESEQGV